MSPWYCLTLLCATLSVNAAEAVHSLIWGADGIDWSSTSRLPDFRRVGHDSGRTAVPHYPVGLNVRDFGALGDGQHDDTEAFIAALAAIPPGKAVLVPNGRYVITRPITVTRSSTVLRGENQNTAVLVLPKALSESTPAVATGVGDDGKSPFAFSGGFLRLSGEDAAAATAGVPVVKPCRRGSNQLPLANAEGMAIGQTIVLELQDPPDHSLHRHLLGGSLEPGAHSVVRHPIPVHWAARITAIQDATVTLDRALRLDVELAWNPVVRRSQPTLVNAGIESLSFEFPGPAKKPHLQEVGYNAVEFLGATECWALDLTIIDADNGIIVTDSSRGCEISRISFNARNRTGVTGHHGLWANGRSQDCLFSDFAFNTRYVHDLAVEGFANGNVFRRGRGMSLNCDHHRNAPYENLFTDLSVGDPSRFWQSGGRNDRGPNAGVREVFWNIRGKGGFPPVPKDWPLLTVVGMPGLPLATDPQGQWVEPCESGVSPPDLLDAQRQWKGR